MPRHVSGAYEKGSGLGSPRTPLPTAEPERGGNPGTPMESSFRAEAIFDASGGLPVRTSACHAVALQVHLIRTGPGDAGRFLQN